MTSFHWFYRVLPGFTEYCWVFFHRVVPGFPSGLVGFRGFYLVYRVFIGFTGFYRVLTSVTGLTTSSGILLVSSLEFDLISFGIMGFYRVLLGSTRFYRVETSVTGFTIRVEFYCLLQWNCT